MRPHGPNCWNGLGALSDLVRLEKNGEKTLKINQFMYVFKNFKNTTILFYSNDLDLESAISPASANFLTNNLSSTSLICNIFMIQFFSRNILSFLFFSVKPNYMLSFNWTSITYCLIIYCISRDVSSRLSEFFMKKKYAEYCFFQM